jgi:diaminopimelate decarboxylase
MMLDWARRLGREEGIRFEFINIGGGLGIPYKLEERPLDIEALGAGVASLVDAFAADHGHRPRIFTESGRYMTGPHGVLVARVINRKETYRTHIGLDASMSALMRPGMYGAYHHIDIVPADGSARAEEVVDVVGSLCENNDKFAIQRRLPLAAEGDLAVIHDTGAHGHSMGFNYNGRLRPKELMLRADGSVELIRRAETQADHFATLQFQPDRLAP